MNAPETAISGMNTGAVGQLYMAVELSAALDMRARIEKFKADAASDLISLKIGLHAGACLAVTLNDRLDYFGQTVNIAARVQASRTAARSYSLRTFWHPRGLRNSWPISRSSRAKWN